MCERHLPLTLKVASKTVAGVYLCVCVCAYTLNCNNSRASTGCVLNVMYHVVIHESLVMQKSSKDSEGKHLSRLKSVVHLWWYV